MIKRRFILLFFILTAYSICGLDFVFQYYPPSWLNLVSGRGAVLLYQLEEHEIDSSLLAPFETRVIILRQGPIALSANGIFSFYWEDNSFCSFNLSGGLSVYLNKRETSPLRGWNFTIYPAYEVPVISLGTKPLRPWKAAFDMGYAFDLFNTPIYIAIFYRTIFLYRDKFISPVDEFAAPDLGITIGFHHYRKKSR
jgi:hypothetical protein